MCNSIPPILLDNWQSSQGIYCSNMYSDLHDYIWLVAHCDRAIMMNIHFPRKHTLHCVWHCSYCWELRAATLELRSATSCETIELNLSWRSPHQRLGRKQNTHWLTQQTSSKTIKCVTTKTFLNSTERSISVCLDAWLRSGKRKPASR